MTCDECTRARDAQMVNALWRWFDSLKCVYCAARLIQAIGKQPIGQTEATARRKAALAASMAAGLDETLIRSLAKGSLALLPLPETPVKVKKK